VREAVHDLNNQLAAADDPRREDLLEIQRAAKRAREVTLGMLAQLPRAD
jgi:hypothetical protein